MKYGIVAVVAAALLLLTSCSNYSLVSDSSSSPKEGASKDKVTLQFWHTYSDIETKVFTSEVLPLFEKEYPNISINAVRQNYTDQLNDNIVASIVDNKEPDLMRMDIIWVPQFAMYGALADLSSLPDFQDIKDQFTGSLIQTNQYHGKYYGLPLNATTMVPIYNKTLLAQSGLSHPPNTFGELIQAAERLKRQNSSLYGISICCSSPWGILPYFWTFGGQLMDPAYSKASGYLDSQQSIQAMNKIKMLFDQGVISPNIIGGQPGGWDGLFARKILMIDEAHWFYTANDNDENREGLSDTVPGLFPSDVNAGTSIIGGENLVLFKNSTHPKEAWIFMKWLVSERAQEIMAHTGLIPSIKNFNTDKLSPVNQMYVKQLQHANPRPPVPEWNEIDVKISQMVKKILVNERPLELALHETAQQIDELLRK